ncbi:hypothetical protein DP939_03655 [Spongiactinospora rosea]|uniref:Uncharacterized protein n=1 Tax=Spongiactinospora rosea TaxID=2248750 RepID=A0A366M6J4_9ACTN|nr:hypothetical protein DP939_03655 [Spongiactinospora rosea]
MFPRSAPRSVVIALSFLWVVAGLAALVAIIVMLITEPEEGSENVDTVAWLVLAGAAALAGLAALGTRRAWWVWVTLNVVCAGIVVYSLVSLSGDSIAFSLFGATMMVVPMWNLARWEARAYYRMPVRSNVIPGATPAPADEHIVDLTRETPAAGRVPQGAAERVYRRDTASLWRVGLTALGIGLVCLVISIMLVGAGLLGADSRGGSRLFALPAALTVLALPVGVVRIVRAISWRGERFELHPDAFVQVRPGDAREVFGWDEIAELRTFTHADAKSLVRLLDRDFWCLVRRGDGVQVRLDHTVQDAERLVKAIEERAGRALAARTEAITQSGRSVAFGAVRLTPAGLGFGSFVIPWREMTDKVAVSTDSVALVLQRRVIPLADPVNTPNFLVLRHLLTAPAPD